MKTNMTQEQIDNFRQDCRTVLAESIATGDSLDLIVGYQNQLEYAESLEARREGWFTRDRVGLLGGAAIGSFAVLTMPTQPGPFELGFVGFLCVLGAYLMISNRKAFG